MIFYLKEEFLSFDHFDIWDENENLVYSADREFFNFGKKLIVQDASGRQAARRAARAVFAAVYLCADHRRAGIRPDAGILRSFPAAILWTSWAGRLRATL